MRRFLLIALLFSAAPLAAQDRTIEVNVTGNFRPVGSQGIIMTGSTVLTKPVIKVEILAEERMVVSIPYKPEEVQEGALATAVLFGPQGEVGYGDVKYIHDSASTKSFYSLNECAPIEAPQRMRQQVALLESLVEIRAARKEAHHLRLKQELSGAFLEKLSRLEKGFGLNYSNKLSPDLNSFELIDRLSRLSNAISNYQSNKGK